MKVFYQLFLTGLLGSAIGLLAASAVQAQIIKEEDTEDPGDSTCYADFNAEEIILQTENVIEASHYFEANGYIDIVDEFTFEIVSLIVENPSKYGIFTLQAGANFEILMGGGVIGRLFKKIFCRKSTKKVVKEVWNPNVPSDNQICGPLALEKYRESRAQNKTHLQCCEVAIAFMTKCLTRLGSKPKPGIVPWVLTSFGLRACFGVD